MSTSFAVTLTPNDWDRRHKPYTLGEREFRLAVSLVDRAGFRPNVVGGIDKRDVRPFAQHLRRALEQEGLNDADRRVLGGLLEFLTGGAGSRGLALTRGWKKWNAA